LIVGVVERVVDGDTIFVRDNNGKRHQVRINWIDAPDIGQKWAKESKASLERDSLGKKVRVYPHRDESPLPSDVFLGGTFLSEKRLRDGWAWNYVPYSTDEELIGAEAHAKAAKRGIWQDKNLQPPWEFRGNKAPSTPSSKVTISERSNEAAATNNRPIERKLAILNGAISAADETRDAAKFSEILDSLHRKCPKESREDIGAAAFAAWEMLKDQNVEITLLDLLSGLDFSIPEGQAGKFKFSDVAAMYVLQHRKANAK